MKIYYCLLVSFTRWLYQTKYNFYVQINACIFGHLFHEGTSGKIGSILLILKLKLEANPMI